MNWCATLWPSKIGAVAACLAGGIFAAGAAEVGSEPDTSTATGVIRRPAERTTALGVSKELSVMLGSLEPYKVDKRFSAIKVGNPEIADVDATSDQSVIINPQKLGGTNILFMDDRGDVITNLHVIVVDPDPPRPPGDRVRVFSRIATKSYHCTRVGCELYDEIISKEPTPPPSTGTTTKSETTESRDVYGNPVSTTRSTTRSQ